MLYALPMALKGGGFLPGVEYRLRKSLPIKKMLYVGSGDTYVYAIRTADGAEQWKIKAGGVIDSRSSPTISGDQSTLYIGSEDHYAYAIGISGAPHIRWKFKTGERVESTPTLSSDERTLYVSASADDHVYAINTDSGVEKWKFRTGGHVYSKPALSDDQETLYVGSWDNNCVYAVRTDDGAEKWRFTTRNHVASSPTLSDDQGTLYIGGYDFVYAIDTKFGEELWKFKAGSSIYSSPILSVNQETLYIGSRDHNVYAIDTTGNYGCCHDVSVSWKQIDAPGVPTDISYSYGVEHSYSETNTETWGHSATRTVRGGFQFFRDRCVSDGVRDDVP